MFNITFPILWSFSYFFFTFYVLLIFSIILYTIPIVRDLINYTRRKTKSNFEYLTAFDLYWILTTPLLLLLIINLSWSSYSFSIWFGHLIFTSFQSKIFYLLIFFFYLIVVSYTTSFYFSSRDVYDYLIICFNFFVWMLFLFYSNTFFTVIFFIEIISTLIFVLLITSTFSTTYFYNNLNFNLNNYFHQTMPITFLQTLMFFFWISLLSSLNLFFFLILFYIKFLTFDFFLFEFVFYYVIMNSDMKDFFFIVFVWLNLLFCIFLKCGLVPFYFWKPMFFKGLPFHTLMFYILFFYFFIFLFFIYFLIIYSNEIFYFFLYVNLFLLIVGFMILLALLCEAYYIKAFLALSSILNTLFVFLAINGTNVTDLLF